MWFHLISNGEHSRALWSPPLWIWCRVFGIHWFPSGRQSVSFSCSRACGRWCTWHKSNAERVKSCKWMASIYFTPWQTQSCCLSTSNFIIGWITVASMLMDSLIPWLTTRTVIYPRHWSCLPALHCAMLSWSGKWIKVFIRKLTSESWRWTELIAWTTSTSRMTVVRMHPPVLQSVPCC